MSQFENVVIWKRDNLKMYFDIIKRKKNFLGLITNSQWSMILLFVIIFCILSFLKNNKSIELIMLFFLFGIIGTIIYRYMDYQKLNAEIIGKLIIEKDFIQINNIQIDFDKIHSVHFNINHYLNELQNIGINDFYKPQYYIGKENYFEITTKDNKEYKGEFLINSRLDFLKLKNLDLKQN